MAWEFLGTGLVPRLPTAVLATGLVLLSFLSQVCGLVLDSVARGRTEAKRLAYLAHRAPDRGRRLGAAAARGWRPRRHVGFARSPSSTFQPPAFTCSGVRPSTSLPSVVA